MDFHKHWKRKTL